MISKEAQALLNEIIEHDGQSDYWANRFANLNYRDETILRGYFSELKTNNLIKVLWADNLPYYISITKDVSNDAMEQSVDNDMRDLIFISHRTIDAIVADMLSDYLVACGFPKEMIFCSSLPGNDVQEKISLEVKDALHHSAVNIMILSNDYYDSAYCLNEAGVIWYLDDKASVIAIGLPEITPGNMIGFIDSDYHLRRLDIDTDIAKIYDIVAKRIEHKSLSHATITSETQKLKGRYQSFLESRNYSVLEKANPEAPTKHLTPNAGLLLIYASQGRDGQILSIGVSGGRIIGAAGKEFTDGADPREKALWIEALKELEQFEFIEPASNKREVFNLTQKGYEYGDRITALNGQIDISKDPSVYRDLEIDC